MKALSTEQAHRESLQSLLGALPPFASVLNLLTLEEQARSVLHWATSEAQQRGQERHAVIPEDSSTCPNCDRPFASTRSPYCSDPCREEAAFVRQFRGGLATGAILDIERQVALGQKLWRLMGGGLPLRVALIPAKAFAKILARKEGRCENCGLPAKHVDHIGTG